MRGTAKAKKGLKIKRLFTREGVSPYDMFEYEKRKSVVKDVDGRIIFEMEDVEVPKTWSQIATDILAQKYMRKTGVPQPDGTLGSEKSVKQVVHRLANCWRWWGEKLGYFATKEDAQAFYDEMVYMLLGQYGAPNSPQWFNTGLYLEYGIEGPPQGHYYVDEKTGKVEKSKNAYERPQVHACFILSVKDDLVNPGGIMDTWVREARLFKYGSGSGANFSSIRGKGEPLSGGGVSSGLMSFLKIGDRAAGAIKSGGTTRRAAKMVIVDIDHPEIEDFIKWKAEEEKKARILIEAGYPADYEGEAYQTISGQNSNNSVRIPDEFMHALLNDGEWHLTARTTGEVLKTVKARYLWDLIADVAWQCADPGVQYDTTINQWNTVLNSGRIRATNPCSEYVFLDDTACNLASLNLLKFYDEDRGVFEVEKFEHACRLWAIVLDISVSMAQYPSPEIAQRSHEFRTLGLGYANLGALLMCMGIPYDSPEGRNMAGVITSIMTGTVYKTSAEMAQLLGPFPKWEENKEHMLRVLSNHRAAATGNPDAYQGLNIKPPVLEKQYIPDYLWERSCKIWDEVIDMGKRYGFRNAHATCIAPTGTIGLVMDCDTTGIEPDFALVKFKKLAGGGYLKIVNQAIPRALKKLGYSQKQINEIVAYVVGVPSLSNSPEINAKTLKEKNFTDAEIQKIERALPSAIHISQCFVENILGSEIYERLGIKDNRLRTSGYDFLLHLGFTDEQIEKCNEYVCGSMTVEGAPHLKEEHYPVFDCAVRCGKKGKRFLSPMAHVKMMAYVQPFVSGAISKTVNMPREATPDDLKDIYFEAWKLGLKAIAIYRDGSKASQPLADASSSLKKNGEVKLSKDEILKIVQDLLLKSSDTSFKRELSSIVQKKKLPARRRGITWKAKINGQTIFVRTGEYEDGTLGEIFIDIFKEGASFRSLLNCFAIAVSIGLQYGVPLEEFVNKFIYTKFEPSGPVSHPYIKHATSILDYIFRLLAWEYLGRTDLLHVQPEDTTPAPEKKNERKTQKAPEKTIEYKISQEGKGKGSAGSSPLQTYISENISYEDAPVCDVCGHMTVRSGTCYRCLNCGHSMGCS